jgi:ribosomal protein S18 acetylase RimI-like enzyme
MRTLMVKGKDVKMIEKIGKSVLPIYYNHEELKMMLLMENYLLLKMMDDNDIIAFMILEKNRKNNYHICSIGVKKKFQRKGIATKLIQYVKKNYKKNTISLNVHTGNKKALECYIKNGFCIQKKYCNYYNCFENNNDAYSMKFFLTNVKKKLQY